jgi:hypothetical protein
MWLRNLEKALEGDMRLGGKMHIRFGGKMHIHCGGKMH